MRGSSGPRCLCRHTRGAPKHGLNGIWHSMSGIGSSRRFCKLHDVHACKTRPWAQHTCVFCVLASVRVGDRGGCAAVCAFAHNSNRALGRPDSYHIMHDSPFGVKVPQGICQCPGRPSHFSWLRRANFMHSFCMVFQPPCALLQEGTSSKLKHRGA